MTKQIDTFSSNSLKVLDKSLEEFMDRYIYNLFWTKKEKRAQLGQKFHSLICFYLKGFDIKKLEDVLDDNERQTWNNLKKILEDKKENFIQTEYSFLTKEALNNSFYCLTGRFDAIYKKEDEYIIYDWKTLNLPKNPKDDLQSIVYLYCFSRIQKSEKIKLRYLSIEKLNYIDVEFSDSKTYKKRIDEIVLKYYNAKKEA